MKNIINTVFAVLFTLTTAFFMLANAVIIIKSTNNIIIAACSCVYINASIAIKEVLVIEKLVVRILKIWNLRNLYLK